jgi:hypothetical protein
MVITLPSGIKMRTVTDMAASSVLFHLVGRVFTNPAYRSYRCLCVCGRQRKIHLDDGDTKTIRNTFSAAYDGISKSFRTESITKYMLTFGITRWEVTQRVMAVKLTRLTHKIAIQLHLVVESYTICSSRSRRPVRILLVTPSYI